MLSWFTKKRDDAKAPAAPAPAPAAAPQPSAEIQAQTQAQWAARVQAAHGDDAALLEIAKSAPVLQARLDAIDAIVAVDALKQAERELRNHDSRVHRAAKRRHAAAQAQREARSAAQAVIDAATALGHEAPLPANRLVAIDRDWQALDAALLEPAQVERFAALREQLNTRMREQGEQEQREKEALRAAQLAAQEEAQRLAQERLEAEAQAREAEAARLAAAAQPIEPPPAAAPAPEPARKPSLSTEQKQQLDELLAQAEAALAEGQLGTLQQQLQAIDTLLDALPGVSLGDKRRARLQALQAERARLKGWQRWGGALALDALVDEAEALARTTQAAASDDPQAPKLRLKAHGDAIQSLRARWKEVSHAGGPASNQTLWQRFDAALTIAHEPVAEQQAQLKAQREINLQARMALLGALDALPVELPSEGGAEALAAHWKEQLRALNHFQQTWRQLGPLEHTVPAAARKALQERASASLARVEEPLGAARRVAASEREQLVARAEALGQAAMRDALPRVRELQAEWQQHARTLPLSRGAEAALWARFKAATDAVYAQREAAFHARDAELGANLTAREAVIAALTQCDLDTAAPAELRRALGDADRAWRTPVEVPRAAVADLEARFRAAREAVAQALARSAQQGWQAQCDALLAKLSLCEQREDHPDAPPADDWAVQAALPAAWEQPLAQRWSQPPQPFAPGACDDLLLQLEAALELPASAEQQAARRDLKLRALKEALEGRTPQAQDPARQRQRWFADLLRHTGADAAQRERLRALIAALRAGTPGALA